MAQIQIQHIEKSFGEFRALKGIDLQIADQEFLVLLGASGCGKSTLLRIMAGLETPDGGHIHVGENRIDNLAPRDRGLSMVFQNYAVFPHLTVFENIAFGLRMQKNHRPGLNKKCRRLPSWCIWKCCCIGIRDSCPADNASVWPWHGLWRWSPR